MSGFGQTPQGEANQRSFLEFGRDVIGSGITTNVAEAPATVTSDPLRSERPKPAPLQHDLKVEREQQVSVFEGLWQWQGGSLPVPWGRLEADGREGTYALIERHRLPPGIDCLRNPLQFGDAETIAWARALRSPDYTGNVEFQFRQPKPGMIFEETQNKHPSRYSFTYPPEALAYTRRQILENGSGRLPWSGLPFGSSEMAELFSDGLKGWVTAAAAGNETMADLVQFAEEYERFMPYQVSLIM
ncbi:hypothetical protein FRC08_013484 [Ceratobasidium sp. 394]|nr:hypothetical protein FRC08_013484 [Ceratobasidium sp. 394]